MPATVRNFARSAGAGGKFIVLRKKDNPDDGIVVFSDFTRDFQHYDILVRWRQTGGTTLESSGLRVDGGGWWKTEGSVLVVYGQSAAYGRFDPSWLRPRLLPGMLFAETAVDVR